MMFHYDNQVVLCLNRTRAWTHRGDERERFNSSSVLKTQHLFCWSSRSCDRFGNSVTLLFVKTSPKPTGWTEEFKVVKLTQFLERWHATHTLSWWGGGHADAPSVSNFSLFRPFLVLSVVTMWIQDWSCVSMSLHGDLRGTDELVMWVHQTQTLRPSAGPTVFTASLSLGTSGAPWRDPTRIKLSLSVNKARPTHNNNYSHDGLISTAAN